VNLSHYGRVSEGRPSRESSALETRFQSLAGENPHRETGSLQGKLSLLEKS